MRAKHVVFVRVQSIDLFLQLGLCNAPFSIMVHDSCLQHGALKFNLWYCIMQYHRLNFSAPCHSWTNWKICKQLCNKSISTTTRHVHIIPNNDSTNLSLPLMDIWLILYNHHTNSSITRHILLQTVILQILPYHYLTHLYYSKQWWYVTRHIHIYHTEIKQIFPSITRCIIPLE